MPNKPDAQPIVTNDDWISAASEFHGEAITKFLLGMRMSPWEQRCVDTCRAVIGPPPESAQHFRARLLREEKAEKG
jgi:hypothetical protein